MSLQSIAVTLLNGEKSTWNITHNLGTLHRPVNALNDDKESVKALRDDPELQASLVTMMWDEVIDMASIARKDGQFGILFVSTFNCVDSNLVSNFSVADRGRVERRVLADIASEVSLNPSIPKSVEFCIADPDAVPDRQVGLWAFVPVSAMVDNDWDYDLLDDVIALLTE